ncbi:MAG TPA: hypothetical protein VF958_03250, partial [Thermoanaerobaculia bacterium]
PPEASTPRRRGPGIAVIGVTIYALLFLGALWYFKREPTVPRPKAGVVAKPPTRLSLLAGEGLAPSARGKYLARIGADHCDCGCELSLAKCLARDRSCVRSPALATERLRAAASPARAP